MKNQTSALFFWLMIIASFFKINAQQIKSESSTNVILNQIQTELSKFNENENPDIDGSPYIDKTFAKTKIKQQSNTTYEARYNASTNEMEILSKDGKIMCLDNNSDYEVTFTVSNKTYRTEHYTNDNGVSVKRFLVVLFDNEKISLFKEERINFYDKVEATSSYNKEKAAKYKRMDDLYFIKINDKITFLPQKKKAFLEAFPTKNKELKEYMKTQQLKPKNEADLILIIDFLSTIL